MTRKKFQPLLLFKTKTWNDLFIPFVIILLFSSWPGFSNTGIAFNRNDAGKNTRDTIEFSLKWNFTGDCGNDCYRFIGTGIITNINGKAISQTCDHVFIKCPSGLQLDRYKIYRFVADRFIPNNCSTIIDTCSGNKFYLLIKEIN